MTRHHRRNVRTGLNVMNRRRGMILHRGQIHHRNALNQRRSVPIHHRNALSRNPNVLSPHPNALSRLRSVLSRLRSVQILRRVQNLQLRHAFGHPCEREDSSD
jgi:hypothetical protein